MDNVMNAHEGDAAPLSRIEKLSAAAILFCTLALFLPWSHVKLFRGDETLEFYSDNKPVHAIIVAQRDHPFSLEPPLFHLLEHAMHSVLPGHIELATRLVSITAFLAMQLCVFLLTRRLSRTPFTALLAMLLPVLLVTVDFAVEARAYSLLAALSIIGLFCYQKALEKAGWARFPWLLGLFAAVGGSILLHYYALFFALPLLAAELLRTVRARKIDAPVWTALVLAYALFLFNLPFMRVLPSIRAHYYDPTQAAWRMLPFTYLWMLGAHYGTVLYSALPRTLATVLEVVFFVLGLAISALLISRWKRNDAERTLPLRVALMCSFLLPILNVSVARLITHAYSPRYSIPSTAAAAVLLALVVEPWLSTNALKALVMGAVIVSSLNYFVHRYSFERNMTHETQANVRISPELRAVIDSAADPHVYMQADAEFITLQYYLPPADRHLLLLTYSIPEDLRWRSRDSSSIYARSMGITTELPVIPFETLRQMPGHHLLVVFDDTAEEWINIALPSVTTSAKNLGKAFGGTLYDVEFRTEDGPGSPPPYVERPLK